MLGMIRRFSLPLLLGLGVAVPYALVGDGPQGIRKHIASWFETKSAPEETADGIRDPDVAKVLAVSDETVRTPQEPVTSVPITDLREVLSFEVTPRWVLDRWPYVSTTRVEPQLQGLRVPLVTGTAAQDVVGSLTYYFNEGQKLQRISLSGMVGDDRHLVSLVTRGFALEPEPTVGAGLFLAKWNGVPTSALWVRRLSIGQAGGANQKYKFSLELNRPDNYFGLSANFQQLLQQSQATLPNSMNRR